jgi:hypothetical protein
MSRIKRSGKRGINKRCRGMKRKDMLMKDHISKDKKLLCRKIKQFIAFHAKRVTNEDTRESSSIKFGSVNRKV